MSVRGLLSDRLHQSALGVVLVLLVTVAYLLGEVLGVPLTHRASQVTVEMTATGGLFEGSSVTYRGVKVGRVEQIRLTARGVVATVTLTSAGERIPVDSVARVRSLSPVGEQYLDFQPAVDHGPWLQDGDVVPATATDLPRTLASTVIAVNRLLDQVDERQLHTLLTELSRGLAGTGPAVAQTVDQADLILQELDRHWPETARLLDNGGTVLDIAPAKAAELRQLARRSRAFAAFLRGYDPELRRLLHEAPRRLHTVEGLVSEAAEALPGFLGAAVDFSDVFRAHEPQLRALLRLYAPGLGVLGKAVRDGYLQILGIPQRNVRCLYGTPHRSPTDTRRRPMVGTGHCSGSEQRYQRGAQHAPGRVG
jgi:phospholipid/cholesterol/gamma-HCH transport system substrate-binding protein